MNNTLAPHIRTESTARHMLLDVLLISVVLCFFSAFCYGLRPVLVVLSGTLSAMLFFAGRACGCCWMAARRSPARSSVC